MWIKLWRTVEILSWGLRIGESWGRPGVYTLCSEVFRGNLLTGRN